MTVVEQTTAELFSNFRWGDPLPGDRELRVDRTNDELHIAGVLPWQKLEKYNKAEWKYGGARRVSLPGRGRHSPHVVLANAGTDEKLLAFVRKFGPVVAKSAFFDGEKRCKETTATGHPYAIHAVQDMQELRNEQVILRFAMELVDQLSKRKVNEFIVKESIDVIAEKIRCWPNQWRREMEQRPQTPVWLLSPQSFARIQEISASGYEEIVPSKILSKGIAVPPEMVIPKKIGELFEKPTFDARAVVCELLNTFRPVVFPSLLEMHSSIKYGIRPLLYSLVRRQFIAPGDVGICANELCRNFFDLDRQGQQYCSSDCSIHQRQRIYWAKRGKKLRKKRIKNRKQATL
jgi:hypothetical protein